MDDGMVEERVANLMVEVCGTDEVLADPNLDLFESGLLDSMGFVELLFGLETVFNLTIPPTEVERDELATVTRVTEFVKARV